MILQPLTGSNRTSRPIKIEGVKFPSLTHAMKHYNISRTTYYSRINNAGMTPTQALTIPVRQSNRKDWGQDEHNTLAKYAKTKTAKEIGIILGRGAVSVLRYANENDICMKKVGEYHGGAKLCNLQRQMIHTLSDAGYTPTEIHKACFDHVSLSTVNDVKSMRLIKY